MMNELRMTTVGFQALFLKVDEKKSRPRSFGLEFLMKEQS